MATIPTITCRVAWWLQPALKVLVGAVRMRVVSVAEAYRIGAWLAKRSVSAIR